MVETIFHPQCHPSSKLIIKPCSRLKNSSTMGISNLWHSFASAVITQSTPYEEKHGAPGSLDGFEKEIGVDAQEIEVVFPPNVPVRIISFKF
jgi:hypothetical protein